MRHVKSTMIIIASLVVTLFLGVAGCDEHHRDGFRGDRDRPPERSERRDSDRHDDDRGRNPDRDGGERGGR